MRKSFIIILSITILFIFSTSCSLNKIEVFQYVNEQKEMFVLDEKYYSYNEVCEYIISNCNEDSDISYENIYSSLQVLLITNENTNLYVEIHEFENEKLATSNYYDYCFKYTYHNYPYFITLRYSNYVINTIGKTGCQLIKQLFKLDQLKSSKIDKKINYQNREGKLSKIEWSLDYSSVTYFNKFEYSHRVFIENDSNYICNTVVIVRTDYYDINEIKSGYICCYDDFAIYSNNKQLFDNVVEIIEGLKGVN